MGLITLTLIGINLWVSYRGIKDSSFLERYSFNHSQIRIHKDYKRFITSSFLHSGWGHLIFNLLALYSFGMLLEGRIGELRFLAVYFGAMIGGRILSLFIHRHKSHHSSVGASGAVSGIVFGAVALDPNMGMSLLFLPLSIPGWIFGLLYVLYSIFGIRGDRGNISHEVHLGGGITGLLLVLLMFPGKLQSNYLPVTLILLPSLIFLYLIVTRPEFLLVDKPFAKPEGSLTMEDRYNASKRMKEKELDRLLDKISTRGIESLSKKEKERLEELSKVK
jgi:membrane associated rhomboid family serine protease